MFCNNFKFRFSLITLMLATQCEIGSTAKSVTLVSPVIVKEETLLVDISTCTKTLPPIFTFDISVSNFTGECARFYEKVNCWGNSVEIRKEYFNDGIWRLDEIKSVGPCAENTFSSGGFATSESENSEIQEIELFEHLDFKGPHEIIHIEDNCIHFPRKLQNRVSSVRVQSTSSEICIDLHQFSDCSGRSVRIRHKPPTTSINLSQWGFENIASSASQCDCNCYNEIHPEEPTNCEHVTLYDERDLRGNSRSITVTECVDLDDAWEGAAESLRLLKDCVMIYTHFGCHTRGEWTELKISKFHSAKENDYNLYEYGFDSQIRSIGPCEEDIKKASPWNAIYMLLTMIVTGVSLMALVNWHVGVKRRRRKSVSTDDLLKE